MLFRRRFSKCPETKALFRFPVGMDTDSPKLLESRRFKIHSQHFIDMLDKALGMLESKELEKNMKSLGALHVTFEVKEEYFSIMGEAPIHTLKKMLKDYFNPSIKDAWMVVYGTRAKQMIAAMKASKQLVTM